jgi:26S proteasome regulatory subunit N8
MAALSGLRERLEEVQVYLARVLAGTLPVNNQIVYNLQDIFNLLPNLNAEVHRIAVHIYFIHSL